MRHGLAELIKYQEEQEKKREEEYINSKLKRELAKEIREIKELLWWESESRFG